MKNETLLVDNKKYKLKKVDMYPHDINWENLNIDKKCRILRKILSYFLIIFFFFLIFYLYRLYLHIKIRIKENIIYLLIVQMWIMKIKYF